MFRLILLVLPALFASQMTLAARDVFDDEDMSDEIHPYRQAPGSEWRELDLPLPAYPSKSGLLPVDISRYDYPYEVFLDPAALTVGEDRVVRYTVILRSRSGAENVSYEGILCPQRRFKRYAYGSGGVFHPATGGDWQFIRGNRQDIYRAVLADEYFCPLPSGDLLAGIRLRLRDQRVDSPFIGDDEDNDY